MENDMEEKPYGEDIRQIMNLIDGVYIAVNHMEGTADLKPKNAASWKEFWENKLSMGFPSEAEKCACCKKMAQPEDFVGAHIIEVSSKKMFVYPLCRSCNSRYGKEKEDSPVFIVDKSRCADFSYDESEPAPQS